MASVAAGTDLARYVAGIRFEHLQPDHHPDPQQYNAVVNRLRGQNIHFDVVNTTLPEDGAAMVERLNPVCWVPRMSTFAIGAVINRAVAGMAPGLAYLNIGVWHGFSLLAGMVGHAEKTCIGVDNFGQFGGPRDYFLRAFQAARGPAHHFHEADYRDYLTRNHRGELGVYFFDGPHTFEDQLDGLRLAEPFFSRSCIVIVDDTNEDPARRATEQFLAASPYAYRVVADYRTACNAHPTWWNGVTILERRG